MNLFVRRFALAALLVALPLLASAETVDELLKKNYDARGGLEKMMAVKAQKASGQQKAQGMDIPFTIIQQRPGSLRIEATVQGQTMVQAWDGKTGWAVVPFMGSKEPEKVGGDEAKALEDQADMDGPLVDWKTKGHLVELVGKDEVDGSPAWKLKLTMKSGEVSEVFLDAETFLEVKTRMKKVIQGNEMEIENFFSNYKPVGEMLMAHSIESRMGGKSISQIVIEKVELNPTIDPKIFAMPPKSVAPASASPAPAAGAPKGDEKSSNTKPNATPATTDTKDDPGKTK